MKRLIGTRFPGVSSATVVWPEGWTGDNAAFTVRQSAANGLAFSMPSGQVTAQFMKVFQTIGTPAGSSSPYYSLINAVDVDIRVQCFLEASLQQTTAVQWRVSQTAATLDYYHFESTARGAGFVLYRWLNGAKTTLATPSGGSSFTGGPYWIRIQHIRNRLKIKLWQDGAGGEPSTWLVDVVDPSATTYPSISQTSAAVRLGMFSGTITGTLYNQTFSYLSIDDVSAQPQAAGRSAAQLVAGTTGVTFDGNVKASYPMFAATNVIFGGQATGNAALAAGGTARTRFGAVIATGASGPAVAAVEVQTATGWVDVTCDVRTIETDRGRQQLLESFQAGTATVVFANFQDKYSAWNPNGVWAQAGRYRLDVPIRITMSLMVPVPGGMPALYSVRLFTGTTDAVSDSWPNAGADAMVTVTATDGFKLLQRYEGPPAATPPVLVGAHELSGARVNRWADAAGWTGPRNVDPGTITLVGTDMSGGALDAMQEVEFEESGYLFMSGDGTLVFKQRNATDSEQRSTTVQAWFTDQDPPPPPAAQPAVYPICYTDIVPQADETLVYNIAHMARTGGPVQNVEDTTSSAWFGPRVYPPRTDLIVDNDNDALALAQWIVITHADNERRVDSLAMSPFASGRDEAWLAAVQLGIGDRIQAERHMPGGYQFAEQLLIQGIHHSVTATATMVPNDWIVTYATAEALEVGDSYDENTPSDTPAGDDGWDLSDFAV